MMTVLPYVMQGANQNLAQSALPNAMTVPEDDRPSLAARVVKALHRH